MASTWRVTGQVQDQLQVQGSGNPVSGTLVYFVTGKGEAASVFVPEQHYNAANVKRYVQAKANMVDEVAGLAEGMPATVE